MDQAGRKLFWQSAQALRNLAARNPKLAPPHPVQISLVRKCGSDCPCDAYAESRLHRRRKKTAGQDPYYFTLRIIERLSGYHAVDVLLHEWAHFLDWKPGDVSDPPLTAQEAMDQHHRDSWGIAYARVYREFYKTDLVEERKRA